MNDKAKCENNHDLFTFISLERLIKTKKLSDDDS
jgi:hypothetical protein